MAIFNSYVKLPRRYLENTTCLNLPVMHSKYLKILILSLQKPQTPEELDDLPIRFLSFPRLTSLSVIWVKRLQVSNADKAWTCSSCLAMFSWFKRISLISLQKMKVLSIQGCPRNALWITVSLTPASGTLGHDASPTFKVTATCPAIRTLLCYVSLCMKLYVCF